MLVKNMCQISLNCGLFKKNIVSEAVLSALWGSSAYATATDVR